MRIALIILALLAPIASYAEPVPVRSGEHATFSRIVTPTRGATWAVSQNGRRVTLSFDAVTDAFDTSTIFNLIPRDRITKAETKPGQLTLTLACDCAVSATTEQNAYVVIDVADNRDDLQTPRNLIVVQDAQNLPQILSNSTLPATSSEPYTPRQETPLAWNPDIAVPANQGAVTSLQKRLSDELQKAARKGILSPKGGGVSADRTQPKLQETANKHQNMSPDPDGILATDKPPRDLANLRISTSQDLPHTFRDLAEITDAQGQVCPPDSELAIATWGNEAPFAVQISEARQGLFGEFDRVDPDVALQLAKTYLYFGFGAEARATLDLGPGASRNASYLTTLSMILDGDQISQNNALTGLADCQGETALWATLVAPMPPQGALPSPDDALRVLNGLPRHLRALLAPKLHQILLAYGDPDAAAATLRSLKRLPGGLNAAAQMAQANTALENGQTQKAATQFAKVVNENSPESPDALIKLVDAKLKGKQPISAETARLVEAYAKELRDTALGAEFQRIQILTLVQSGQFDAAFETLDTWVTAPAKLHNEVLTKLTTNASDIVFLEYALDLKQSEKMKLSAADAFALAERLLDLGFSAQAESLLSGIPDTLQTEEHRLLAARISLAMAKPFRAQADLLNLNGDEAIRLRADAQRMSGAYDAAHQLYTQLDRTQDALETAWLADDWRALVKQEVPTFGPASALPPTSDPTTSEAGMLARTSGLLNQSTQARQTLEDLLGADDLQITESTN